MTTKRAAKLNVVPALCAIAHWRRDPYRVMSDGMHDACRSTLLYQKRRWLWVPAFAGTTAHLLR
jgi:hypothetical protein